MFIPIWGRWTHFDYRIFLELGLVQPPTIVKTASSLGKHFPCDFAAEAQILYPLMQCTDIFFLKAVSWGVDRDHYMAPILGEIFFSMQMYGKLEGCPSRVHCLGWFHITMTVGWCLRGGWKYVTSSGDLVTISIDFKRRHGNFNPPKRKRSDSKHPFSDAMLVDLLVSGFRYPWNGNFGTLRLVLPMGLGLDLWLWLFFPWRRSAGPEVLLSDFLAHLLQNREAQKRTWVPLLCACVHVAQKQRRNYTVTSLQKRKEFADIQIHIFLGASVTAEVS